MSEKLRVFLFGFCYGIGDDLYHLLNQDYDVCYWIGDNDTFSDDIHSYLLVSCEQVVPTTKAISEYLQFYSENFQHYLLLVQRRGLYYKDFFEIRNSFNILFHRLLYIIEEQNPEVVIFSNIPHEGADYILYQLCKERNIKTLIFYQSLFPNVVFAQTSIDDFGHFKTIKNNKSSDEKYELQSLNLFYMEEVNKKKDIANQSFIYQRCSKLKSLVCKGYSLFVLILTKLHKITYGKILNKLSEIHNDSIFKINFSKIKATNVDVLLNSDKKIIYLPLHLQPELTTSAIGGHYEDQLNIIEYLSCHVGDNYMILVKENPKQNGFQRGSLFFSRIDILENVKLVDINVSSQMLIEHSDLVALVSGTAGWEAIQCQTKCMVFGQAWYAGFPGCYSIDEFGIMEVLNQPNPSKSEIKKYYQEFMSTKYSGIIDSEYLVLVPNFTFSENAKVVHNTIIEILKNKSTEW